MSAFFDSFENTDKKYLITNTKSDNRNNRNTYIKNNAKSIQEIEISNVFSNGQKAQHNRYIIIAENKEKYTVWQLPSSIDYIRFVEREIEPNTKGTIKDSISFNQVDKKMLKPQLRTFIENKL